MSDEQNMIKTMVGAALANEKERPTPERIRELIKAVRGLDVAFTDKDAEDLACEFEELHEVMIEIGTGLDDKEEDKKTGFQAWLPQLKADPDFSPYFWDRHRQWLGSLKHMNGKILQVLDQDTDNILGRLENPRKTSEWDRRGLVLGHVQSGKTQNYTSLICKAADAGYKVIIVIAGVHNNLRTQTQGRIDEGFIGTDSATKVPIGVYKYGNTSTPAAFTTTRRDFNKPFADGLGINLGQLNVPVVFVIKKNNSTLRTLIEWLKDHNFKNNRDFIDEPMLVVDDEADNASINIRYDKGEVAAINSQIRELLEIFRRSCYVGYTATPFANIFIDPVTDESMKNQDLFPRHFIYSLDAPTNYFGAREVFLDEESADRIVRFITDNEEFLPATHKIDHQVLDLPESMMDAVRSFILVRAIRLARGKRKKDKSAESQHNSMLVNASRFTRVQTDLKNAIHLKLSDIQDCVKFHGTKLQEEALKNREMKSLFDVWMDQYGDTDVPWDEVQPQLHRSAASIQVIEVNSAAKTSLNYKEYESTGLNVIAVGGFALSRGLTLEGLSISYFLRNSMMYDTLMQMCRWFGYRPGYDDLCRVWMPEQTFGWYEHIARAIEELREEIGVMEREGATPEEFGLKVRSHPDSLVVTARNRMGSGETHTMKLSLKGQFREAAVLRADAESMEANRKTADLLAEELNDVGLLAKISTVPAYGLYVPEVPVQIVMNFISRFRNHAASPLTDPEIVQNYIKKRLSSELSLWDVCFTGVDNPGKYGLTDDSLGISRFLGVRSAGARTSTSSLFIGNSRRISRPGVAQVGLGTKEITAAEEGWGKRNVPDHRYIQKRRHPLLIIHKIGVFDKFEPNDLIFKEPVVSWGYIMPPLTEYEDQTEEFVVTRQWREIFFGDLEDDYEEEMVAES